MQRFALTVFNAVGDAAIYQTAIFAGLFDSLVDHEQHSDCCDLRNVHPVQPDGYA